MTELVKLIREGDIRHIVLNAPERLNALDRELLDQLQTAVETVTADKDARALIVRGEGRAFCAGANLDSLFGDVTRPTGEIRQTLKAVYASFLGIRDLKIPTISAVQGAAVGAGLNIALVCDIVVAGPKAKFGATFAEIGIHPSGGCTWMLVEKLGAQRALAVLLEGRSLTADEALTYGLAAFGAEDPAAKAFELATLYASRSPQLVKDIKRAVQIASTSDLDTTLEFEGWAQASSLRSEEFAAFAARFTAK
ncbi:enoyl-CoA hydratase [soil metagenome]